MELQSKNEVEPIQLINKNVVIRSGGTKSNDGGAGGDNPSDNDIEFTITDGELEIIPLPIESEAAAVVVSDDDGQGLNVENITHAIDNNKNENQVLPAVEKLNSYNPLQIHPLQIQLVIENIGKYLTSSPKDLMSARQVCKQWSKTLKPFQTVQLTSLNTQDSKLRYFLRYHFDEPSASQFTRYQLNHISFENPQLYCLFVQYGEYMKKLIINIDQSVEFTLIHFRDYILSLTPNLVQLIMHDSTSSSCGRSGDFKSGWAAEKFWNQGPIFNEEFPAASLPRLRSIKLKFHEFLNSPESQGFMNDLLSMANNLEYFSFKTFWNRFDNPRFPINSIISALSNKPGLDKLKGLRLHFDFALEEITQLIQLSERKVNALALNKFSFLIPNWQNNLTIAMYKFLQLQSLKSLNMKIQPSQRYNGHRCHVPAMTQLESLKITTAKNTLKIIGFDGPFHTNFPGLKSLRYKNVEMDLADGKGELMSWFHPDTFTSPHLLVSKLQIGYLHKCSELVHLSKLFPNVVQLDVGLVPLNLLTGLWNSWPNVENLTLTLKKANEPRFYTENRKGLLLDEYITGIPKDYFKACMSAYKASNYSLDCLNELKSQFKMLRGISHLKRLSHFELKSESGVGMSDISIYFGLIYPNSKFSSLVIGRGHISMDCRSFIHDKLGPQGYVHFGPKVQKWCVYD